MNEYIYILTVRCGNRWEIARCDNGSVSVGDLVRLGGEEIYRVLLTSVTKCGSDEMRAIIAQSPVAVVTDVYAHRSAMPKEEANEPA